MQTLLIMDAKDYTPDMPINERRAARALIYKEGKIAVQRDRTGKYKMLGGAAEPDETIEEALIREVAEEAGLVVVPASITPIGEMREIRADRVKCGMKYIAHSYYYGCMITEERRAPQMTASECACGFELVFEDPAFIYAANSAILEASSEAENLLWLERDTLFIKMLIDQEVTYGETHACGQ